MNPQEPSKIDSAQPLGMERHHTEEEAVDTLGANSGPNPGRMPGDAVADIRIDRDMPDEISLAIMKRKRKPIDLGAQLREAFRRSGLTRFALAKQSGVPYSGIHRFVAGERDISLSTASRLCDVLGVEFRPTDREKV
jgi:helix-turn-helix protein